MNDRYDELAPKHLVTTLRSLRRRWSEVTGPVRSDTELFARIDEVGPGGSSLGELTSLAAHRVEILSEATRRLATHDGVRLVDAVLAPVPVEGGRRALEVATATIGDQSDTVAELLERIPADDWSRVAELEGGGAVDLVTLARALVRHGVEGLRQAEAQVAWLRSTG